MTALPTLLIDLDNTLCRCSDYYWAAEDEFVAVVSTRTGVPEAQCKVLLRALDLAAIQLPNGFSSRRYPNSFKTASLTLDLLLEHEPDWTVAEQMWVTGNNVFYAPYALYDGVLDTLHALHRIGWHLVLVTKGEDWVQRRKIEINGLGAFFDPADIFVTLRKDAAFFRHVADTVAAVRNWTLVVGDSLKEDVGGAAGADLRSVWVKGSANTGWAYEDSEAHPTFTVETFAGLEKHLCVWPGLGVGWGGDESEAGDLSQETAERAPVPA